MSQFDLKKASIYFVDGYSSSGAVNNAAGYPTTTTTMLVDGITGIIPVNATFKLAGDDNGYQVSATVETLSNTTSITFTPGLKIAATDNQVITFGGRQLYVKVGEGNMTYEEKRNMEYKLDRGVLDTVREGDEVPLDVKLDMQWEFLSAAEVTDLPTVEEVLKKEGNASAWTSSSADTCEPYAIDILIVYFPECEAVKAETILLQDYRWESFSHDLKAGTLSTSGKCNVTRATKARVELIS